LSACVGIDLDRLHAETGRWADVPKPLDNTDRSESRHASVLSTLIGTTARGQPGSVRDKDQHDDGKQSHTKNDPAHGGHVSSLRLADTASAQHLIYMRDATGGLGRREAHSAV
jgi:hypothetical protein